MRITCYIWVRRIQIWNSRHYWKIAGAVVVSGVWRKEKKSSDRQWKKMWEVERKPSVWACDREEKRDEREGRLSINPDCFSSCTSSCSYLYDVQQGVYFHNNQPILIPQHILCVSSLREQPVRFIAVFLEVQSMVQCQDPPFCWAVCGFLSWHKTTGEKHSQASRKQSEADMHSKTSVCPERMLIKQTDGAQNTVKTMRKNICLLMYV